MTVGLSRNLDTIRRVRAQARNSASADPGTRAAMQLIEQLAEATEQALVDVHREAEQAEQVAGRPRFY